MYYMGAGEGLHPFDPLRRPALRCGVRDRSAYVLALVVAGGVRLAGSARAQWRVQARSTFASAPPPAAAASQAAAGRHDGEAVRGERTGDAVRDDGTHRSLPRQRRGKLGVQGGRSAPLASPFVGTKGRLAYAP